ncbi:hypothetical protein NX059_004909 [Plenodomus lindquistii]|nr:hypothetical protein NX059_004909 [Plenodomus lindquistii]
MDDIAASQQLLSESRMYAGVERHYADALDTTGYQPNAQEPALNEAASPLVAKQLAASKKRKSNTLPTSQPVRRSKRQETTAMSQPSSSGQVSAQAHVPESSGLSNSDGAPLEELQNNGTSVEVPDSQYTPNVETPPSEPPPMSSIAVPASMPETHDPSEASDSVPASGSQYDLPHNEDTLPEEVDKSAVLEQTDESGRAHDTNEGETVAVPGQDQATRKLKPRRSAIDASTPLSFLKRPRRLRRPNSRYFGASTEEIAENLVDSDQNLTETPASSAVQVPGEELRSAKKAKRRHGKEKAAQIIETPAESLQTPPESLSSSSQALPTQPLSLQTFPKQLLPKAILSSSLAKRHRNSEIYDWQVSPSKNTDVNVDAPVFDERDLDTDVAEQGNLENDLDDLERSQPANSAVEDSDPENNLPNLHSPDSDGDAVADSELQDADESDLFVPEIDAQTVNIVDSGSSPHEDRDQSETEELAQVASREKEQPTTNRRIFRSTRVQGINVSQRHSQEPELLGVDSTEELDTAGVDSAEELDTVAAAEKLLQKARDLPVTANKRTSGGFTEDEKEIIRRAVRDYQQIKGWETDELVRVIQWRRSVANALERPSRIKAADDEEESKEFWEVMKKDLVDDGPLMRRLAPVKKYIRSQYHDFKRSDWTKEEDDKLLEYYALYSASWVFIGPLMNRTKDDVESHWKEHLRYSYQKMGHWTEEEEAQLVRAVNTVAQREEDRRYEAGWPPQQHAHTIKTINWAQVVSEMGNVRDNVQASVKWKDMMKRTDPPKIEVDIRPRSAAAVPDPIHASGSRTRKPKTPTARFINRTPHLPISATLGATPRRKRGRPRKQDVDSTPSAPTAGSINRTPLPISATMGATPRRKRGRPRKQEVNATPSVHQSSLESADDTADVAIMLPGDKFDLVEHIMKGKFESEEDIDWDAAATQLKQAFSVRTLQEALRDLFALVDSDTQLETPDSLQEKMQLVLHYLEENHGHELGQHYDPFNVGSGSGDEIVEDATSAPLATSRSSRKRKAAEQDDSAISRRATRKKKQKTSVAVTRKPRSARKGKAPMTEAMKSKEFITESDEAVSEPELSVESDKAESESEL